MRNIFPWIINEKDSYPKFDLIALKKFIDSSHDQKLGWVRPPNSYGSEAGKLGEVGFSIDGQGSRNGSNLYAGNFAVVFGDSYAFCRQVGNSETWEAKLAQLSKSNFLNFGVGNYGVDQALLRFKQTIIPADAQVAILCFVPETISRILSYWKHYLEFGNTFAFKPRFKVLDGNLELIENYAQNIECYQNLFDAQNIGRVNCHDYFYENKFRKLQFRHLYIAKLFLNLNRNIRLFFLILTNRGNDALGPIAAHPKAFQQIMKENTAQAHSLYADISATALLELLLLEFKNECEARNLEPVIIVIPQLLDLAAKLSDAMNYEHFYKSISNTMACIDLTSFFRTQSDIDGMYIEDNYGGHLSAKGNEIVAKYMYDYLFISRQV